MINMRTLTHTDKRIIQGLIKQVQKWHFSIVSKSLKGAAYTALEHTLLYIVVLVLHTLL